MPELEVVEFLEPLEESEMALYGLKCEELSRTEEELKREYGANVRLWWDTEVVELTWGKGENKKCTVRSHVGWGKNELNQFNVVAHALCNSYKQRQ